MLKNSKTAKFVAVVAGFAMVFSTVGVPAKAQTTAELTAQINSLLATIAQLQAQVSSVGGTTTTGYTFNSDLTIGSTGNDVSELQKVLVAQGHLVMPAGTAYGYFGTLTQAAVARYQAANGITPAAGYVGPVTRAKLNSSVVVTTPTTPGTTTGGTLTGGAGDLTVKQITSGTETTVSEGKEENVLGADVEADYNSDIAITSVRVTADISGSGASTRLTRYADEFIVYLNGKEVGSLDAADFTRNGADHSGTINLSNAIVKKDTKVRLYVALVANDVIRSEDRTNGEIEVGIDRIRYEDASGAILTETPSPAITDTVDFDDATADDGARVQSTSNTPDAAILQVKENSTSDEYHVFTFRLRGDSGSSDLSITSLPIKLNIDNASTTGAVNTDDVINDIYVEADGMIFDDYDRDNNNSIAANTDEDVVYTFDIDEGDLVIEGGSTIDVKVYVKFGKQENKYSVGTVVKASVTGSQIDAENDRGDTVSISGSATGKEQTIAISSAVFSDYRWEVSSVGTTIDFFFTVEADGDEGFDVLASSIASTTAGTATTSAGVLSKVSGDATTNTPNQDYTVEPGDEATFRITYTVGGSNGQYAEVTITKVAGQEIPNNKQLSPRATLNINN